MPTLRRSSKEVYVFLSYRRRDLEPVTELAVALNEAFGDDHVFFDQEDIHAGARWAALLDTQVLASDVLVVAITNNWLSELEGRDPHRDFVLREISLALRERIPIIPLLFPAVPFLQEEQLPAEISGLMTYQAVRLGESEDCFADVIAAIKALVVDSDRDARRRKVNEAKVMAQWFDRADADEEVLGRGSGTKDSDPVLIVSDRRLVIGLPKPAEEPTEVTPQQLYAVRYDTARLWLVGLDFEHKLQRLKPGSPEELAAQLRKQRGDLDIEASEPDLGFWMSRRIERARQHLRIRDELFATAGDTEGDAVLFVTPQASIVFRRKKKQEGSIIVDHAALGAVCVHKRGVWLLDTQDEHKIDNVPIADVEKLISLLRERAPKALFFRKAPDRAVRESMIVLDPHGLAAQKGIDLSWTTRLRPTDEEAIVLAAAKLRLMEEDLASDPDWSDRIPKRQTIDAYARALASAFAGEVAEDENPIRSLAALRSSIDDGEWADRFKATLGEMHPDDVRRALLDEELQSALFSSVSRRDRSIIQLVELASFYPWGASTKFEKNVREQTCRRIADDMAADAGASDFDFIDRELKRRAKKLGGTGVNWIRLIPLIVGGTAIGIATGGLATPLIGGTIGSVMGLSGAAATSAGLALLGGGSLAAGGAGMAGGMALIGVLGGVVGAGAGLATDRVVDISREGLLTESVKLDLLSDLVLLSERKEARQVASVIELLNVQTAELDQELSRLEGTRKESIASGLKLHKKDQDDAKEEIESRLTVLTGLRKALSDQLVEFIDRSEGWPLQPKPEVVRAVHEGPDPSLVVAFQAGEQREDFAVNMPQVLLALLIKEADDRVASIVITVMEPGVAGADEELRVSGIKNKVTLNGERLDVTVSSLLWASARRVVAAEGEGESTTLAEALRKKGDLLPAGSAGEWMHRHGIDLKRLAKALVVLAEGVAVAEAVEPLELGEGLRVVLDKDWSPSAPLS